MRRIARPILAGLAVLLGSLVAPSSSGATNGQCNPFTCNLPSTISAPSLITAGPDGALWFTDYSESLLGRLTTTGEVTDYSPVASLSRRGSQSGQTALCGSPTPTNLASAGFHPKDRSATSASPTTQML
jgi:streptogramin lyase